MEDVKERLEQVRSELRKLVQDLHPGEGAADALRKALPFVDEAITSVRASEETRASRKHSNP